VQLTVEVAEGVFVKFLKLICLAWILALLASCGGGGSGQAGTNPNNPVVGLFTTAPSSPTLSVNASQVYSIGGGYPPYVATTSNIKTAVAGVNGNALTIGGVASGSAVVSVIDTKGTAVSVSVTVVAPTVPALTSTAPPTLTLLTGSSQTYPISGGLMPYSAVSSNPSVATASVSGSNVTISASGAGSANILLRDSLGTTITVAVTVANPPSTALFTTAPAAVSLVAATSTTYTIGGGTAPYTVVSSAPAIATVYLSGTSMTINALASGSAQIVLRDAAGATTTVQLTVTAPPSLAFYTTAPGAVTLLASTTTTYALGGGAAPYLATSSNASVATVSVSGTSLNVTAVAAGSATIALRDSLGATATITVTVNSPSNLAFFTTAPQAVTLSVGSVTGYTLGGGKAPYTATSSNLGVVTTSVSGTGLNLTAVAAGSAQILMLDSAGASLSIAVTVSPVNTTPLAVNPAAGTGVVGDTVVIAITGGTPPYSATVSNPTIASVSISGNQLTSLLKNAGTTPVIIVDAAGATVTASLTVSNAQTQLRLSPSTFNVGEDSMAIIPLSIYGGIPPYSGLTSNLILSSAQVNGNVLNVGLGTQGSRCVAPSDVIASPPTNVVTITVVDANGAVATSLMTIADTSNAPGCALVTSANGAATITRSTSQIFTISGGFQPYQQPITSDAGVATATLANGNQLTILAGSTGGKATITVTDSHNPVNTAYIIVNVP
jgi:hypothetical protein